MRWDNLRLETGGEPPVLPLVERGATVRTFDTPEFKGVTFYEVNAKSIINKVPPESRMSFRWTINPYRGCTHACTYCLAGDTPILMADGTSRPLADIEAGDLIYGTVPEGDVRRYTVTQVHDHWSTVKPAWRVTLGDGTQLISSAEHRFLTTGGWKHVSGGHQPRLALGDVLVGTGQFATPAKSSPEYRRGYLCGVFRGAGHLGSYSRHRPDGGHTLYPTLRLETGDLTVLDRAGGYLQELDLSLIELVRWPTEPDAAWHCGFLAGVFDTEGGRPRGVLTLAPSDPEVVGHAWASLRALGFHATTDDGRVRVLGGLAAHLRFFHTVDPVTLGRWTVEGSPLPTDLPLDVVAVEPLGIDLPLYDLTTGTGDFVANGVVSHNCFARNTHTYLDLDAGHDFDTRIVVKVNAVDRLRRELESDRWTGEHIAMGTNVDPYQRAEGRYRLMRGIIGELAAHANPFSILTKGTLVLRDLDLLTAAAARTDVRVNLSIGSLDQELWRAVESGTPHPRARVRAAAQLVGAGLGCGVLMAPILPYLTDGDEQLEECVAALAEAGVDSVTPIVLHLRPGAREWYLGWLREAHPELVPRYRWLYRKGSYARPEYGERIRATVAALADRYGITERAARFSRGPLPAVEAAPDVEQLSLL
ncbi:MAG: intein-containing Rv2578c family radical SAM protein [Mycobacteriales bacterium]